MTKLALTLALALAPGAAMAQARTGPPLTAPDSAAIKAVALDYIEGWYQGDPARMTRALHPELAKRNVATDPATGRSHFTQMSALTLIQNVERGGGSWITAAERRKDVRILDGYGGAAVVRIDAATWVDYLELSRINGRWMIVNVLWENDPKPSGR